MEGLRERQAGKVKLWFMRFFSRLKFKILILNFEIIENLKKMAHLKRFQPPILK